MKRIIARLTGEKFAGLTIYFCCTVLAIAGIIMLSIGKAYEAGAAFGGLALIGLFLFITRRLATGSQRVYFQAIVIFVVSQAILLGTILDLYDRTTYYDK